MLIFLSPKSGCIVEAARAYTLGLRGSLVSVRFPPITDITTGSGCTRNAAYCFNRYPVLNTHAMPARHSAIIPTITATLDHTGTSATPKKVQRKPLTR